MYVENAVQMLPCKLCQQHSCILNICLLSGITGKQTCHFYLIAVRGIDNNKSEKIPGADNIAFYIPSHF